jgi:hypothetical protein
MSRAVALLRTTMVDSGVGAEVFRVFLDEGEDRRVTFAALMCVCNLVNDCSPLRPVSGCFCFWVWVLIGVGDVGAGVDGEVGQAGGVERYDD